MKIKDPGENREDMLICVSDNIEEESPNGWDDALIEGKDYSEE